MIYLLSLICALLPTYLIRFSIFGIPTTVLETIIYFAFLIQIINFKSQISKCKITIKSLKLFLISIVLLFISLIISVYISPDKRVALGIAKAWFFDPILLGGLVFLNVKSEKDFGKIVYGFATGAAFISLWGILQWFGFDFLLSHQKADTFNSFASYLGSGRVFGPFESPNYLGMYLAPISSLTLAYWLNSKFKSQNAKSQLKMQNSYLIFHNSYFLSFCLVAMLLALLFTKSLGAWLGFGVAAIFLLWYFVCQFKPIIRNSYFIIPATLFVVAVIFLINKLGIGRITDSFAARKEVWQVSWHLIKQHPVFGIGLGTFRSLYEQIIPTIHFPPINWLQMHPHNIFLAFWLNLGILGLISFIWILVLFFRNSFKLLNAKRYTLIPALVAAMLAIIAHGLIDTTYWKNDLAALFWLIVGLSFALNKFNKNEKS